MSFRRFLNLIKSAFSGGLSDDARKAILRLDPRRIYVENVRSMLDVSFQQAKEVCETAVRNGVFIRMYEVRRPDGSVAAVGSTLGDLPATIKFPERQPDGSFEDAEVPIERASTVEFFKVAGGNV